MNFKLEKEKLIRIASHCINCISHLQPSLRRGVRTRARQLFEVLEYQGLAYLFAYVGGKATERALREMYISMCKDGEPSEIAKELDSIRRRYGLSDEDASYGLYGASLMCVIAKIMNEDFSKRSLEELIYNYGFNKIVRKITYEVARWLKFLAEAKLT